jgi:hypothetical protein
MLIRSDMSGGELLVVIKIIGVHLLYYERGFKQQVRRTQWLGI